MLQPSSRPMLARILDLGDRALHRVGLRRNRLSPEAIKSEAAQATRLDDFGPPDFEEGLAVFCRSVEEDGKLDLVGREVVRRVVRRVLSNRLLLVDYHKRHQERQDLVPPLIVLGLPRTGTTYLHRLLAQAPGSYGPPAWQVWRPLPRTFGPDRRREITISALEGLRKLSPQLDVKHYQEADEPEECYHLLDPSFRAPGLSMFCRASGYFQWVRGQDLSPAYRMYRQYLQIIQRSAPDRRLTLKAPLHTPYMKEITAEIPSVRFVQTHRDPVKAAGSLASLCYSMFAVTSARVDARECGELALLLMQWMAERCVQQRSQGQLPVVDVQYSDLIKDPLGTVRRIHGEHGLGWTSETEHAVQEGIARRPQHKQGRHRYDLSDFGLTAEEITRSLESYQDVFSNS